MNKKAQVIICKCGGLIAGWMEPYCYEDKDWQKDVRKSSKEGCEIKIVDPQEVRVKLEVCKCKSNKEGKK